MVLRINIYIYIYMLAPSLQECQWLRLSVATGVKSAGTADSDLPFLPTQRSDTISEAHLPRDTQAVFF